MNQRLAQFRQLLRDNHLHGALVRSTDCYLNEYVPLEQSRRAYLTGFTGSTGDALVSHDQAILFVDGRYAIQAKAEAPDFEVRVSPLGQSIETAWREELVSWGQAKIGLETDKLSVNLFEKLSGLDWAELPAFGPTGCVQDKASIWSVPESISGESTQERLKKAAGFFKDNQLDAFLVVPLDEIAWLTNQRSSEFPYQAVFSARALAFPDRLELVQGPIFIKKGSRVGLDPALTPEAVRRELQAAGAEIVFAKSPFQYMKSIKNPSELNHMRSAIARADRVVATVQAWVCDQMEQGVFLTEATVDQKVRQAYEASGVTGLSFKPICAAGKNGAQIHYGTPDNQKRLQAGDLFLLDSGAYYEGGYATDLTRTFLLGGAAQTATEFQKKVFTAVLKGAIAGMSARFPKGTTGVQLDAIVRDPIWRMGYNFNHGTGHGVGVNVHEDPPRVSPAGTAPIEESQVFSIEPGIYLEGFGGVRIENLCTAIPDPEFPGFLKVVPLSFCPLDARLIAPELLTEADKLFLEYYKKSFPVLL